MKLPEVQSLKTMNCRLAQGHRIFILRLFIYALLFSPLYSLAQLEEVIIYGQLKDEQTLKKIDNATITVLQNGTQYDQISIGGSGSYETSKLPLGHVYDLKFQKDGYIHKIVRFDTRNIRKEDYRGGFKQPCDVHLFKYIEGFNTSIMDTPMGIMAFDSVLNAFAYDVKHTEQMNQKIEAEKKRLKNLAENMDKLKKEFDALMAEGDKRMSDKKYGEAADKFDAALKIFPENQTAKQKYDEAKKKYEEELKAKELEAQYAKLLADGEKNMKAQNWDAARRNYQDAQQLKPSEKLPKDKLAEIDKLLAGMANDQKYNGLIDNADAKFASKDYAVAIEKYKEASALKPTEIYPKNQIQKAQQLLDAMLADEAERQRIEKQYQDMIARGDKNFKAKDYSIARQNFEEALNLKPNDAYATDRLAAVNKILDDLAAKEKANADKNAANAEAEKLNADFKAHVEKGNSLFDQNKLIEARAEYEAAHSLKPAEKYPKSRIERIDEMLAEAQKTANADDLKKQKEEERKQQEELARQLMADKEKQAEAERLARKQKEDEEQARLAAARAAKEEEDRKKRERLASNIDSSKEDEVERYYREARRKEEEARNKVVTDKKENHQGYLADKQNESAKDNDAAEEMRNGQLAYLSQKSSEADEALTSRIEATGSQKDVLVQIHRQGELVNNGSAHRKEVEKEKVAKMNAEMTNNADSRRIIAFENASSQKGGQQAIVQSDRYRATRMAQAEKEKDQFEETQKSFASRGDALRKDRQYQVKKDKMAQENMPSRGEEVRERNQQQLEDKKTLHLTQSKDLAAAAEEHIAIAQLNTEKQKNEVERMAIQKQQLAGGRDADVAKQLQSQQIFQVDKEMQAANKRYESRNELFDKNAGRERTEDEYMARPGSESLPEGVSENSYQLGNKIVIERTVKIGNKVDLYRKVVSKTGTYYFKNDQSITERTWKTETLQLAD